MLIQPQELIEITDEIEESRKDYLQWKAVVDRLERGKNSVLGEIILRLRVEWKGSADLLRLAAYADHSYLEYLQKWMESEKKMVTAKIKYDNLDMRFEALRTVLAYQREGIKMGVLA